MTLEARLREETRGQTLPQATFEQAADFLREFVYKKVIKGRKKRLTLIKNFLVEGSVHPCDGGVPIGRIFEMSDNRLVRPDESTWVVAVRQLLEEHGLYLEEIIKEETKGKEHRWSRFPNDSILRTVDYFPTEVNDFFIAVVRDYSTVSKGLCSLGIGVTKEIPKKERKGNWD